MTLPEPIAISTRGSQLARWQAEYVSDRLAHPTALKVVKSKGDRLRNVALQGRTDQGFFTKEIQAAVLDGEAHVAVHSLKDLPTARTPGLALAAVPPRGPVEDVLLVHPDWLAPDRALPVRAGGAVGATSLRRQSLLAHYAPDLSPQLLRGNVPTRLQRLRDGEFAAILLARAGLHRLGLPAEGFSAFALDPAGWIPAPGQAALGVETPEGSAVTDYVRQQLDHEPTHRAVALERRLMARFEAGCHAPFAAWANGSGPQVVVYIGSGTDQGGWAAARVEAPNETEAEEQAWRALQAAREAGAEPGAGAGSESPCQPISSF